MPAPLVGGDLLEGARAIGQYLGVSPRRALYLLENRQIPSFKIGHTHVARRSTLQEWLNIDFTAKTNAFLEAAQVEFGAKSKGAFAQFVIVA